MKSYLFPSGSVRNLNIYHSSFDKLASIIAEARQQVALVIGQAVVHKQDSAEK